jgi:hypothetical protein
MDEFVHRPKPFKSQAPKVDQFSPPTAAAKAPLPKPLQHLQPLRPFTITSKDQAEPPVAPPTTNTNLPPLPKPLNLPTNPPATTSNSPISTLGSVSKKIDLKLNDDSSAAFHLKTKKKRFTKKFWLITLIIILVLGAGGGAGYWYWWRPRHITPVVTVVNNEPTPTPTPTPAPVSPLTGIQVASAAIASRPVTGLMIENSEAARPQSGLLEAGVVFEAIAEGGITRFLALYQESQPQYIGPIRSIRPYYIDFAMGFDAAVGHAGGSPDALNDIASLGMKNLEAFQNGNTFWRISDRDAPHNLYTSFEKLDALNTAKSYTSSTYTPFGHKKDIPQTPTATTVDFSISSPTYSPRFVYDATNNAYKRFQDGEAHVDAKTGTQIEPKVVIALIMGIHLLSDGSHNAYDDTGSGKMFVFQDGIVSTGTWAKKDRKSTLTLTDQNGLPMLLNTGQAWISIVSKESDVTYKL